MDAYDKVVTPTIDREFMRAKMLADPINYRMSTRLLRIPPKHAYQCFSNKRDLSIIDKLMEALKLPKPTYGTMPFYVSNVLNNVVLPSKAKIYADMSNSIYNVVSGGIPYAWFIKGNNMYINDEIWYSDLMAHMSPAMSPKPDVKSMELAYDTLQGIYLPATMYLAATGKDSIALPLLYSMMDLTAMMGVTSTFTCSGYLTGKPKEPAIKTGGPTTLLCPSRLGRVDSITELHSLLAMPDVPSAILPMQAAFKTGAVMTLMYGCELMYRLSNLGNFSRDLQGYSKLLSFGFSNDSYVARHLYSFDAFGDMMINEKLYEEVFDSDNSKRFENILEYVRKALLGECWYNSAEDVSYFKCLVTPTVIARIAQSMHDFAWREYDDQTIAMLYAECKVKGIDLSSLISAVEAEKGPGIAGISTAGVAPEAPESDPFTHMTYSEDTDDKSTTPKPKSAASRRLPTPDILDSIKKDIEGNSRYSFSVHVKRSKSKASQDAYNAIAADVKMLDSLLVKKIKEIKTYNSGGKQSGLDSGKLDIKNLWKYRTDPHIFCNNTYKIKEMDLAFAVVLDRSGSMSGTGIANGRVSMILIHEALRALGIDHMICAHDSNRDDQVNIQKYWCFDEDSDHTLTKPYYLAEIGAGNGNCDSGALYYVEQQFKAVPHKDKICLIFSDGQPTECSDKDLRDQVQHMEKSGIHVIGIGINYDEIAEYYPDHANGKTLSEMIKIITDILGRYVLENKD